MTLREPINPSVSPFFIPLLIHQIATDPNLQGISEPYLEQLADPSHCAY